VCLHKRIPVPDTTFVISTMQLCQVLPETAGVDVLYRGVIAAKAAATLLLHTPTLILPPLVT
jgi:hypothetical protein